MVSLQSPVRVRIELIKIEVGVWQRAFPAPVFVSKYVQNRPGGALFLLFVLDDFLDGGPEVVTQVVESLAQRGAGLAGIDAGRIIREQIALTDRHASALVD